MFRLCSFAQWFKRKNDTAVFCTQKTPNSSTSSSNLDSRKKGCISAGWTNFKKGKTTEPRNYTIGDCLLQQWRVFKNVSRHEGVCVCQGRWPKNPKAKKTTSCELKRIVHSIQGATSKVRVANPRCRLMSISFQVAKTRWWMRGSSDTHPNYSSTNTNINMQNVPVWSCSPSECAGEVPAIFRCAFLRHFGFATRTLET